MTSVRWIKALLVGMLLAAMLTGCSTQPSRGELPPSALPSNPQPSAPIPAPVPETYVPAPLLGVPVEPSTIAGRAVAVMIDNAPTARPHYGLSRADVLYEMLVEGGVTRIMAVFHSRQADVIGPVRSVRLVFVEKALELGAILVHCGGSEEALQSIPALGVRDIDEIGWTWPFWRDWQRYAPHNLFTSSANLAKAAATRQSFGGATDQPVFAFSDSAKFTGEPASEITIRYPAGYAVSYRYDGERQVYSRLMNEQLHVDMANNEPLEAVNVVIEVIPAKVMDSEGRLRFYSVGRGEAYVVTHGTLRKGQWVKDSSEALTRLVDEQGKEISLAPGVTWVQQVTPSTPVEID